MLRTTLATLVLAASDPFFAQGQSQSERDADWLAAAMRQIEDDALRFVEAAPGRFGASNAAHALALELRRDRMVVTPESGELHWTLSLGTRSVGRGTGAPQAPRPESNVRDDRAELRRDTWSEWFVNTRRGVQQGWLLREAPPGDGALRIELVMDSELSFHVNSDSRSGHFVDASGTTRLGYGGLLAWDASGRSLAARLVNGSGGPIIEVDDREARYPVTVDPFLTGPAWQVEGDQPGARMGVAVASAGDVNADGFSDVLVGAPFHQDGEPGEGRAYLFLGSSSGPSTTPAWTADGNQIGASFGIALACAGDVDADGHSDVIIGASELDGTFVNEGSAFLFRGTPNGLEATPSWSASGGVAGARFGFATAGVGDVDGDGFSDVVVGATNFGNGQPGEGAAFLYRGSASGLASTPSWSFEGNQNQAAYGWSVAPAGDVNADGYDDFVVGAANFDDGELDEGAAFLHLGSPTGPGTTFDWMGTSNVAGARFGTDVDGAGDVNADGFTDVIVGAPEYTNGELNEGAAFLYLGSPTGLAALPQRTIEGQVAGQFLGVVGGAGDANGDGFDDVAVGATGYANPQVNEGAAFLFLGSSAGLEPQATWIGEGDQLGGSFGNALSFAGDVNGDGFGDLVIGGSRFDDNASPEEGRAVLYFGCAQDLETDPSWMFEGEEPQSALGWSVAFAGDVNGDGFSDALVGAPLDDAGGVDAGMAYLFEGGPNGLADSPAWTFGGDQPGALLGAALATAGDVDGDGYDDVLIAAPFRDVATNDEGMVWLFRGGPTGLETLPSWSVAGSQAGEHFGASVGSVGDADGDGRADVFVSSPEYDGPEIDEGRISVFYGRQGGLESTPRFSAESDQPGAGFGASACGTGDIDGDGFDDLAVGSPRFDEQSTDQGVVVLYRGSPTGLEAAPFWDVGVRQPSSNCGASVAAAGDVNGDGFADLLVGVPGFRLFSKGLVMLYLGSPNGPARLPDWIREGVRIHARLGEAVAGAGDVNRDGYADLVCAAPFHEETEPDEGRVELFLGSASGPAATPTRVFHGEVAGAQLGSALSGSGDADGDGFADVLVGVPGHDGTGGGEGRALLLHGNGGRGSWLLAARQQRPNGAPLSLGGSVGARLRLKVELAQDLDSHGWATPQSTLAYLEWEVVPLGEPFDALGLGRGAVGTPLGLAGATTVFDEVIAGLERGHPHRWRARIVFPGQPLVPCTPWFTSAGGSMTETKFKTRPKHRSRD